MTQSTSQRGRGGGRRITPHKSCIGMPISFPGLFLCKLGKEIVRGFEGRHLRIRDICIEFERPLTGHRLVTTQ